jgi:tetratricopeptide (TPR) repeat protein
MKIALLNDAYFLSSLRASGHSVFFAGAAKTADFRLEAEGAHELATVLAKCPFEPDLIIYSDSVHSRCIFTGLESTPIPLIFYGVNSTLNEFWQFDYARVFDLIFLDQKESVERLQSISGWDGNRVIWLPPAADADVFRKLPLEKEFDISFIGSLNPVLYPKRAWLLEEITRRFPVAVFDSAKTRLTYPAEISQIYNRSKLVLNDGLPVGLSRSLFEAMGSAACVLIEAGSGSWRGFFRDGVHLVVLRPDDFLRQIEFLLKQDERRRNIAVSAMDSVHADHTVENRTRLLLNAAVRLMREHGRRPPYPQRVYNFSKACIALSSRWRRQYGVSLAAWGADRLYSEAVAGRESAPLHFELAAHALEEQRLRDALNSLQRALTLDPAHLRSVWALFWCCYELEDRKRALLELRRICQHLRVGIGDGFARHVLGGELDAGDFFAVGEMLEKMGWFFEPGIERSHLHPCRWNAYDAYQRAVALDPTFSPALIRCADLLESHGFPDRALLMVLRAIEVQPDDVKLRLRCADLMLKNYRRREAFKQIFRYLISAMEADKWERVEKLKLTEAEWNRLLDAVWKYSRKSTAIAGMSGKRSELRAIRSFEIAGAPLQNLPRMEPEER